MCSYTWWGIFSVLCYENKCISRGVVQVLSIIFHDRYYQQQIHVWNVPVFDYLPDILCIQQFFPKKELVPGTSFISDLCSKLKTVCNAVSGFRLFTQCMAYNPFEAGRDKINGIFQTTFSNGFSWMKMYELRLQFRENLFRGVQLTIPQYWFR